MKNTKLTTEEKAARREQRKAEKEEAKRLQIIQGEREQKPVSSITISIVWKKSRMWGYNPHGQADIHYKDGTYTSRDGFTCSGCGYDKTSTVVADIFNTFLKYKLWQKTAEQCKRNDHDWKEKGGAPYGIGARDSEYLHRSYDGGIGVDCYWAISEFIGGKFEKVAGGDSFDVYKYTDGE